MSFDLTLEPDARTQAEKIEDIAMELERSANERPRLEEICIDCAEAGHPSRSIHESACRCGKPFVREGNSIP
jgi:hypothetical protein